MPVIRDVLLNLDIAEVLRREGFGGQTRIRPEIKSLILELQTSVREANLLEPAIAYEIHPLTRLSSRASQEGNTKALGPLLSSVLPGARELAVVLGTIGPRLEKQVTDYSSRGKTLRGVLLDGIGSAAVDALSREACKFITDEASSSGYEASSPVSPGMPGLPITEQRELLKMVPAQEIGVSLTSSGMMVPRKSASMVIGIGPKMKKWTRDEVCAQCSLNKTCPHRLRD